MCQGLPCPEDTEVNKIDRLCLHGACRLGVKHIKRQSHLKYNLKSYLLKSLLITPVHNNLIPYCGSRSESRLANPQISNTISDSSGPFSPEESPSDICYF